VLTLVVRIGPCFCGAGLADAQRALLSRIGQQATGHRQQATGKRQEATGLQGGKQGF